MTHMPVKANEVFYYKQPRNKSLGAPRWIELHLFLGAPRWIELHLLLTSIDSQNRYTEIG